MKKKGLLIIDLQNDYFPGGRYPLRDAEKTLARVEKAVESAKRRDIFIILVQHVADPEKGMAPFFNEGSEGVELHPKLLEIAPGAPVIVKGFADSFLNTGLDQILENNGIEELLICGMMTQNCVTHTAISKSGEKYKISVLGDCCTSVDGMIHQIALNALSARVPVIESKALEARAH